MTNIASQLIPVVDEGLGNSAYLLDVGDGRALAVDPPRDLRALRAAAAQRDLRIAWAADTHLHADFLTGAVQLAATDGAQVLASAAGARAFDHRGLTDGDEVDLGGLTLRALATPGHTDEHLSFVLLDGSTPAGVFTGGSLIVGSAARTDLLGRDRTIELTRAQYLSLRRLADLPDATAVWPTHGTGSFCSPPSGTARTSTIGAERIGNPLLAAPDVDTFIDRLLGSLGSYPPYFRRLAEVNRRGPEVIADEPRLLGLTADQVRRLTADGAVVVDVRPVDDVAAGHIPGALAIPLGDQFATWLGWLVDSDVPVVVVRNPGQNPADILWPALNIGADRIVGELAGGMAAWTGETITTRLVGPDEIDGAMLDVRQTPEYTGGHVPTAAHVELGALAADPDTAPDGPTVIMCGHGERAMSAATLLERHGRRDLSVLIGGPADWGATTGQPLRDGQ